MKMLGNLLVRALTSHVLWSTVVLVEIPALKLCVDGLQLLEVHVAVEGALAVELGASVVQSDDSFQGFGGF